MNIVDDETLIIGFQGSVGKKDLLSFFNMKQSQLTRDKNVLVHSGFLRSFREVEPCVTQAIKHVSPKSIIFCGHSKGGSLAKIASLYYSDVFRDLEIACDTFGSPKVGNEHFVDIFDIRVPNSFSMIHENDYICSLPVQYPNEKRQHIFKTNAINPHKINAYEKSLLESIKVFGDYNANMQNGSTLCHY